MKNRLYDATKIDWDNLMFSTKELWMLLIPIMVEQMLNSLMGMADTMMVSNVGSVAMSAVSLVDSINTLVIQVFAALATGAAIICSHYLGKGDERGANKAARQIFLTVIVISLTITAGGLIFCRPLLRLIFGAVEPAVMEDSIIYFLITASSYPFIALFNAGGAFSQPFGSVIRSLLVAIFELGVEEIMVIAHSDCGACHMHSEEMLEKMKARGINADYIHMMSFCGVDFHSWLDGFEDTEKSVRGTVDFIVHHPLIPSDVKVHGFIIDSTTGELTRIV